jgi:hypothetical protein
VSSKCESDFRLLLCVHELQAIVGGSACRRILSALEAIVIVIRFTVATGSWINVHTNAVAHTVQVQRAVAVALSSNSLPHIATAESYCRSS